MKGKYIITTDEWFYAPDGRQYRAVYGEVNILSDSILEVRTNSRSTNWYAMVGTEDNHVIIAGCQVHYAVKTDSIPKVDEVEDFSIVEGQVKNYIRPSQIYITE